MQSTLAYYLNGNKVGEPDNWRDLEIQLSFEDKSPEATLNANKLTFKGPEAAIINTYFKQGNIFQGLPLQIKTCASGEIVFDGICDISDVDTLFNCDIINVKIRDKRMDMITELFYSISYSYLATPVSDGGAGIISSNDYVTIPYQVNNVPDYIEFVMTLVSIYEIVAQAEKIIKEIFGLITASAVTIGGRIAAIVEFIFWIVELIAMILIVVDLIEAACSNLVAPVYNKLGMNVLTLVQKACSYFGLQFQSTILQNAPYNTLTIMPAKQAWAAQATDPNLIKGFFSAFNTFSANNRLTYDDAYNLAHNGFAYGYFDGTPGDLMDALSTIFNARAKIIFDSQGNPVLHFERWDYQYNLSSLTLPNISDVAPFQQNNGTNASEIAANYLVQYQTDSSDWNTLNVYDGTSCYAQTTLTPVPANPLNTTLTNLVSKNIPFSQGLRKNNLTSAEQLLNNIYNAVGGIINSVIDTINTATSGIQYIINKINALLPSNFKHLPTITIKHLSGNPFNATLGILQLSNNVTQTPKLMLMDSSSGIVHLSPSNRTSSDPIAARNLVKNFHFSSLGLTVTPSAPFCTPYPANVVYFNQYYIYDGDLEIPLCCADYNTILNNNVVTTYDGKTARVDSLKYNTFKNMAKIKYRVQTKYCPQLSVSYCIDGATYTNAL